MTAKTSLLKQVISMFVKAMEAEGCTPEQVEAALDRVTAQLQQIAADGATGSSGAALAPGVGMQTNEI